MIQVVKVLIENDQDQFLLIKRADDDSHGGKWETPGGGVKKNEELLEAAHREVLEEVGLDIGRLINEGRYELRDDESNELMDVSMISLESPITNPIVKLSENPDHSDYIWLHYSQISDFLAKGNEIDRWTLTQIITHFFHL